jgi:hypothetical protein
MPDGRPAGMWTAPGRVPKARSPLQQAYGDLCGLLDVKDLDPAVFRRSEGKERSRGVTARGR